MVTQTRVSDGAQWTYVWDYRNRLIEIHYVSGVSPNGNYIEYFEYDVFNRRIARSFHFTNSTNYYTYDHSAQLYFYDGDHVVLDYYDDAASHETMGDFELGRKYLYGPAVDQLLAHEDMTQPIYTPERVLWYLADNQNTTRDLVDNAGDLAGHFTYKPFGQFAVGDGSLTRYLYTGREYEQLSRLQYNRNRWYNTGLGRWMSEDPIGFEGDPNNLYRYVRNGPTYAIDPTGLAEVTLDADAFIPSAWVSIPPDPWQALKWGAINVDSFVKGDNRGVSNTPSRGSRTRIWSYVTLDTCSLDNWHVKTASDHGINSSTRKDVISPWYYWNTWTEYTTGIGTLHAEESGWKVDHDTVMGSVTASGRVPFKVAALPVAINYEYTLRLTQIGKLVIYSLNGTHDAFPGHEVYISYDGRVIDKHLFTPTANGWVSSPLALAGWGSVDVHLSGVFEVNEECACI